MKRLISLDTGLNNRLPIAVGNTAKTGFFTIALLTIFGFRLSSCHSYFMTEGCYMTFSFSRTLFSIAISSTFYHANSYAANNLDQVIVSATRVEQSVQDYTGNITVITADELQEKAIQTLPEALDRIAGIPMYSNGGLGSSTSVFLHGQDSKRILLLVDGMRFNDPSGTSGAQWQHLLVSDIERIEILEGAQAGIWGADAGAGVVNVITKSAKQGTHGKLSYAIGSLGQKQTQASASYANSQFDARVGYTGLSSDEFSSITPITNSLKANPLDYEKDGYKNDTLNAKLGWNLAQHQRLELNVLKADAKGNYDGYAPNNLYYASYQQQTLGAQYHFMLADWKLIASAQQGNIDRDFNASLFNAEVNQQSITANRADQQGSWALGADLLTQSTKTMSNASIQKSNQQDGVFIARTQRFYLPAFTVPTIVNLSLRNDDFSDYQSYVSKRIGVKQMINKDAYAAINLADSRRMPNLFERFIQYNSSYQAAVRSDVGALRPETVVSKSVSLGWKGYELTRFEDQVTDLINYDSINRNYYNINGESTLQGWQWKASEHFASLSSELSLIYQVLDAKDQTGIPLARRPNTSGSLNWSFMGIQKTLINLQTQFIGDRIDSYNNTTGVVGPNTGNYWLWHANASYQWNKSVRVFMKGINLTDERIAQATNSYNASTPSYYYAYTPRTILTGIEYQF